MLQWEMDAFVGYRAEMNIVTDSSRASWDNEKDLPKVSGRRKREKAQMQAFPTSQAIKRPKRSFGFGGEDRPTRHTYNELVWHSTGRWIIRTVCPSYDIGVNQAILRWVASAAGFASLSNSIESSSFSWVVEKMQ
jgi:hypothetical protein